MSSARPTYYTARQVCVAFLEEYLAHRLTMWSGTLQSGANAVGSSHATERKLVCKNFIQHLKVAETQEQLDAIIFDLEKAARNAQSEKETPEKTSVLGAFYNIAYGAIAPYFIKENSLFAKVCHAARTCLIAAKKAKNPEEYQNTIQKLKISLKEKEAQLDHYLDSDLSIEELEQARDDTYYRILAMQDWKAIKKARINHTFPASLPEYDIKALELPDNLLAKLNIPLVYNDNYCDFYFYFDIHKDAKRGMNFYDLLKKAADEMESRPIDIVSGEYFQPLTLFNPTKIPPHMTIFAPTTQPSLQKQVENVSNLSPQQ